MFRGLLFVLIAAAVAIVSPTLYQAVLLYRFDRQLDDLVASNASVVPVASGRRLSSLTGDGCNYHAYRVFALYMKPDDRRAFVEGVRTNIGEKKLYSPEASADDKVDVNIDDSEKYLIIHIETGPSGLFSLRCL